MPAARLNLEVEQGATFSRNINFNEDGQPIDLTDRVFKGNIRASVGGPLVTTFDFEIPDQTTSKGNLTIKLNAQKTALIPVNRSPNGDRVDTVYLYSIEQTFEDGTVERSLEGKIIVSPRI